MAKTLADYKTEMDNAYAIALTAHTDLTKCVKGKGTTDNCSDGQPLGTGGLPKFGLVGNPGSCKICNSLKDCTTDCCNEKTCKDRMNDYNTKLNKYNVAKNAYNTALADPQVEQDVKNTEADRKTKNGVIIAIVIVVIAVVIFIVWKKYGK